MHAESKINFTMAKLELNQSLQATSMYRNTILLVTRGYRLVHRVYAQNIPLKVVSLHFRKALCMEHFTIHQPATKKYQSSPKFQSQKGRSIYKFMQFCTQNTNQSQCSDWGGIYSSVYITYGVLNSSHDPYPTS